MAKYNKKEQYELQIKNEVNTFLRTVVDNKALAFVSITKVEMSADFALATLYWDTFDANQKGDIKKAMEGCLGKIRSHLAKNLAVRHTPALSAEYDSQFEDSNAIDKILQDEKDKGRDF
ncbi:MAG: ribosome-binding factor A [Bacteriovorax sp. MedPE-SWde]|mgnify:CR=1 FL=1|nr:MAG: ribosome-binding factor A [Bacteriovorax sp. MedPE-SWde]